ncbi:MAG: hypothetical protein GF355_11345 [Candidatus Eisenbacteria bacterium]|nr:hypothetical protein [Candidatus Eisenbacteria bacterium]
MCDHSNAVISQCLIAGNEASGVNPNAGGGGIICFDADASEIEDCHVTGNRSALLGGGFLCRGSQPRLIGCTVAGNLAADMGGGIACKQNSTVELQRTIVWGNCADSGIGDEAWVEEVSIATLYCCALNEEGISGSVEYLGANVFDDPLFCGGEECGAAPTIGGDYSISAQSPCIPESSPCGQLIGAIGVGCGWLTATEMITWGKLKYCGAAQSR